MQLYTLIFLLPGQFAALKMVGEGTEQMKKKESFAHE